MLRFSEFFSITRYSVSKLPSKQQAQSDSVNISANIPHVNSYSNLAIYLLNTSIIDFSLKNIKNDSTNG